MPITPFQIINPDGSTNQAEYDRCIEFLNQYVNGEVRVYADVTWENPFEIDMTQEKSAYTILRDVLMQSTNRLLTRTAFQSIKQLFTGLVQRTGSTIRCGYQYLQDSKNFIDGPGYMYDVFTKEQTEVKHDHIQLENPRIYDGVYYLDDENHTVICMNAYDQAERGDTASWYVPDLNIPANGLSLPEIDNQYSKTDTYRGIRLSGVNSDFYVTVGEHLQSSILHYYSQCLSPLYTTGGASYYEPAIDEIINFTRNSVIGTSSKPAQGLDLASVSTARSALQLQDKLNAYISPSIINPNIPYNAPNFFTSANASDWLVSYTEPES